MLSFKSQALPAGFAGTLYLDFLAEISRRRRTRNYLEIGVHFGHALCRVACDTAVGVDPSYILEEDVTRDKRRTLLYRSTSDGFFAETDLRALVGGIDLAFLDGLHQFEFLLRDFYNTEAASTPSGLIILHDCMPLNVEMTTRRSDAVRTDPLKGMWTGDVWKLVPILRKYRPDLDVLLVDCPPTGLVCVTGLDPDSRILSRRFREFRDVPDTADRIAAMYAANSITRSADILNGEDHSLYFPL